MSECLCYQSLLLQCGADAGLTPSQEGGSETDTDGKTFLLQRFSRLLGMKTHYTTLRSYFGSEQMEKCRIGAIS